MKIKQNNKFILKIKVKEKLNKKEIECKCVKGKLK